MLGRVVVPIVDVECLKRCPAIAMVRLSRFQKSIPKVDRGIGKRVYVLQVALMMSGKFIQPGSGK